MKNDDIFTFENPQDNTSNEIYSSSNKGEEYEDVYSSSSANMEEHYYRSDKNGKKKQKKNKRKKRKGILIAVLSVLTVLLVVMAVAVSQIAPLLDYNYNDIDMTNSELGFDQIINNKIINVALFGVDTRNTESLTGNTDSIMILSVNTQTKKIKIISILRDSLVQIEKEGNTSFRKINSAYAMGGPELAIKTINQNFNLDISEYATVNFFGMADIIDAVGGIDVELTEQEVLPVSSGVKAINETIRGICAEMDLDPSDYYITTPGKHHLNGIQAVGYSRIRYVANIWGSNDDYGRTERQRYVMEQLFNSVKGMEKSKYLELIKALISCTETSLSVDEIFSIATKVMLGSPTMEQSRIPLDEYKMSAPRALSGVGSYVYFDRDYAAEVLHAFIYDDIDPTTYMQENEVRKNDWYADVA